LTPDYGPGRPPAPIKCGATRPGRPWRKGYPPLDGPSIWWPI